MKTDLQNGVLTIAIQGRVDTTNAAETEEEIRGIRNANPHTALVADFQEVPYISSAGLRSMLRLKKEEKEFKIVNVSPEVYEIFEMTGFTEMMEIVKAYRTFSVEGCEVIGTGSNGVVYRLDPETIIKVYRDPNSLPEIQKERELARTAFVLGIPTAIPYDVCRVGDTYGSVFELLNARSMAKVLKAEPESLPEMVRISTDILKKMHATEVHNDMIPSMREVALGWVSYLADVLPKESYEKLRAMVEAVPESDTLLHGDYHIKNIMMQDGEALLIDMDTLCHGNPVFEFGSIYNAYQGFSDLHRETIEEFLGISYEQGREFFDGTMKLYFETEDPERLAAEERKAKVIGYTRLLRRTLKRNAGEDFAAFLKENLIKLIDETDTLIM